MIAVRTGEQMRSELTTKTTAARDAGQGGGSAAHRRGVRYRLAVILGLALCAVVAGARSFTAVAEWAADADEQTRRLPGITDMVPCRAVAFRDVAWAERDDRRLATCAELAGTALFRWW